MAGSVSNNGSGYSARTYAQASQDPCGYVTDSPDPLLAAANTAVTHIEGLAQAIREADKSLAPQAFRLHNLARLAARKVALDEDSAPVYARLIATISERMEGYARITARS